ncbi:MAG: LysE family translocator [Alphaproteobacteria bacterium]|nr:MAG: LysE family translocator [Alphaproteobacteria bacterium]
MALASLLAFALTCVIVEITPGPNMAWLAALSLARGWRVGLAAVAGVALGLSAYGVAAALGVAAAIENSAFLYETLRWGGVAYLLWLAWDAWSTAGDMAPEAGAANHEHRSAFRRGVITNLLNPKAAVFYIAVLPEFVTPQAGSIVAQTLTLSAIYVAIATAIHALIVISASRLRELINDPARLRPIRRILAVMLAGVAIWLAWSTAR